MDISNDGLDQDPREDGFVQDPYPLYARLRAVAPLAHWRQYGFPCLSRLEAVNACLRDRRFGRQILHVATRADLGLPGPDPRLAAFDAVERHSLLELEPPAHTRLRGLVTRAFVGRELARLRPRIEALAGTLIDRFAGGTVDLLDAYATPIPVTVIAELLGVDPARTPDLLAWSHAMVGMYQFARSTAVEEAANAAAAAFAAFIGAEIASRRRARRDDLLSHLVAAEIDGARLGDEEIVSTAILLLNAGHEATVHAIGNGVKALLESGLAPAAAFATEARTAATVEEMLRFDPPLHMFTRFALADVAAFGHTFRKGDRIGLLLGAANRDGARFPEPDRFDPTRSAAGHVAFGAGIHFCIGAPLARLELEVALPILFRRCPRLAIAATPRYRDSYHFHGLERLDVEVG